VAKWRLTLKSCCLDGPRIVGLLGGAPPNDAAPWLHSHAGPVSGEQAARAKEETSRGASRAGVRRKRQARLGAGRDGSKGGRGLTLTCALRAAASVSMSGWSSQSTWSIRMTCSSATAVSTGRQGRRRDTTGQGRRGQGEERGGVPQKGGGAHLGVHAGRELADKAVGANEQPLPLRQLHLQPGRQHNERAGEGDTQGGRSRAGAGGDSAGAQAGWRGGGGKQAAWRGQTDSRAMEGVSRQGVVEAVILEDASSERGGRTLSLWKQSSSRKRGQQLRAKRPVRQRR
jgi:hypothetical protein